MSWVRFRVLAVFPAAFFLILGLSTPPKVTAASTLPGDLPRRDNRALEQLPGLDSVHGTLTTRDGIRLRTILTKPAGHKGRLPAILFVQWLSCDSVELKPDAKDGWSRMLLRVARESNLIMMRTEKRGVGDSEGGPCNGLDYETELSDHREALRALRQSEYVDPDRIIVFGASMGGNYAPLVAAGEKVAGVIVWGGGAKTWFERMMTFERHRREWADFPSSQLDSDLKQLTRFFHEYLVQAKSPARIARENAELAAVWSKVLGAQGETHYGRPVAFHQQAQKQDWAAAWDRVNAPVLVLYGEYDWYEDAAAHALIARIANRKQQGRGKFRVIPKTDHHFMRFSTQEQAVADRGGIVNEDPVVQEILVWLREVVATSPKMGSESTK